MAVGWAGDNAVNDQIRDSITDEIKRVRAALPKGKSLDYCEECGDKIPDARREALPGVRLCIECQEDMDKLSRRTQIYNRKGSKDSQLR